MFTLCKYTIEIISSTERPHKVDFPRPSLKNLGMTGSLFGGRYNQGRVRGHNLGLQA